MRILKKSKAVAFVLALLLAFSLFSDFSCAQSSNQYQACILTSKTGIIKIHTTDTQGVPISDAVVYLDSHYVGVTDQSGWLTISDISPGDHAIAVTKEGFADYQGIFEVFPEETLYLELEMREFTNLLDVLGIAIIIGGGILIVLKCIRKKEEYPYRS